MKVVGYTLHNCSPRRILFVVKRDSKVKLGQYFMLKHPYLEVPVIIRVFDIRSMNYGMETGRIGALAGSIGITAGFGKELEYLVAICEPLGYVHDGKFRSLDVAPPTWSEIYKADVELLRGFIGYLLNSHGSGGIMVPIGKVEGLEMPYALDLDRVARGHMFVAGMTRSGKSVSGEALIRVYDERESVMLDCEIKDFVNRFQHNVGRNVFLNQGFKTVALSRASYRPTLGRVYAVYRHRYYRQIYSIITAGGKTVKVTGDHSLLVWDGWRIQVQKARSVRKGFWLISPGLKTKPASYKPKGEDYLCLSRVVRRARVMLRLSQETLSLRASIPQAVLSLYERGCDTLSYRQLRSVYEVLADRLEKVKLFKRKVNWMLNAGSRRERFERARSILTLYTDLGGVQPNFSLSLPTHMVSLANRLKDSQAERALNFIRQVLDSRLTLEKVVDVYSEPFDGYVYDLGVEGEENFMANQIFLHNSTFALNLVRNSVLFLKPRPRFIVFDRRGEYSLLADYGGAVFTYREFMGNRGYPDPRSMVKMIGLDPNRRVGKLALEAIISVGERGEKLTPENILHEVVEIVESTGMRGGEAIVKEVEYWLKRRGKALTGRDIAEPLDPVEIIRKFPVVVVDLSVDYNYTDQFMAVRSVIERVMEEAIDRRDKGDFSVINIVEEAQYFVPERGAPMIANPQAAGIDKIITEAISQAGGYNVGFIILTQRPAYVSKNVISQCNTVVCFRMRSGNDQEAIAKYTEQGSSRIFRYLPDLPDHYALVWGMASPIRFPVIVATDAEIYPAKTSATPTQAWEKMEEVEKTIGTIELEA